MRLLGGEGKKGRGREKRKRGISEKGSIERSLGK